ncbi:hypothetical protein CVT26_013661 [Gymnopilus dilepis]|uniref:Uncharacterized protein n=1 Tax=Gymnopilus dilepis TaxID=231916 RepID=A0A409YWD1_9AGAR|nr:hypothetical protein CVT26_013661 [Gymnopilus dilepis]
MLVAGKVALVVIIIDEQRPARPIPPSSFLLTSPPTSPLMIASGLLRLRDTTRHAPYPWFTLQLLDAAGTQGRSRSKPLLKV